MESMPQLETMSGLCVSPHWTSRTVVDIASSHRDYRLSVSARKRAVLSDQGNPFTAVWKQFAASSSELTNTGELLALLRLANSKLCLVRLALGILGTRSEGSRHSDSLIDSSSLQPRDKSVWAIGPG
ncbi:hypothetical protein RRG08_014244 [Elysia crispata]|uniref:Uncharacterized protein n=1 Tax=Elysia crispata TaxID=231223 RepID=A0AAE1CEW0_9GAST|nr:hypothetical protein RRG08_014244 [Elysia crispata]